MAQQSIVPITFYGSTEASLIALSPLGAWRKGCAGVLLPDIKSKFCSDGELLLKTPGIMHGYFSDEITTRLAFTEDGYYKTTDICELSDDGHLIVLGRKKDVFGTSEGSYIYPARIEAMLELLPEVHQAALVGDGRPFNIAFVVLSGNVKGLASQYMMANNVATGASEILEPHEHEGVYRLLGTEIEGLNVKLERIERIHRFFILNRTFSNSCYEITPGSKVRRDRKAMETIYAKLIDVMYADTDPRIAAADPSFVPGITRRLRKRTS